MPSSVYVYLFIFLFSYVYLFIFLFMLVSNDGTADVTTPPQTKTFPDDTYSDMTHPYN